VDKSQVLNLDDPLNRLALLEAVQLLDQLRLLLEPHGQSDSLRLCYQICLRLCFVSLQAPVPQVDRDSLLALHHHAQTSLALRLDSLQDSLQTLARESAH
jgi:hypothetical protein